jgi:hypothetical protein
MTQLEQAVTDLSKGFVPITVLSGILLTSISAAYWFGTRSTSTELTNSQLTQQVTRLEAQVIALGQQMQAFSVSLAKGPAIPDNVAFKADLYKFCIENRTLKCPTL